MSRAPSTISAWPATALSDSDETSLFSSAMAGGHGGRRECGLVGKGATWVWWFGWLACLLSEKEGSGHGEGCDGHTLCVAPSPIPTLMTIRHVAITLSASTARGIPSSGSDNNPMGILRTVGGLRFASLRFPRKPIPKSEARPADVTTAIEVGKLSGGANGGEWGAGWHASACSLGAAWCRSSVKSDQGRTWGSENRRSSFVDGPGGTRRGIDPHRFLGDSIAAEGCHGDASRLRLAGFKPG